MLRKLEAARSVPAGIARRARIVLLAAEGLAHTEVARRTGTSVPTVRHWRDRYSAGGIEALADAPRAGRPRSVDEVQIVTRTLQPPPAGSGARHWSSRLLATELGVAASTVVAVWRSYGLQPWSREGITFSTHPAMPTAVSGVVGLYLNPPQNAVVVSTGTATPSRSPQPDGIDRRFCHCARHATTDLRTTVEFAIGRAGWEPRYSRRRTEGLLEFLHTAAASRPGTRLHIVCDAHPSPAPAVRAWLARNPRIGLHTAPTGRSWLDMVEIFFAVTAHRTPFGEVQTPCALSAAIDRWEHRRGPFRWVNSPGGPTGPAGERNYSCAPPVR